MWKIWRNVYITFTRPITKIYLLFFKKNYKTSVNFFSATAIYSFMLNES
jgi:hypothetical protein